MQQQQNTKQTLIYELRRAGVPIPALSCFHPINALNRLLRARIRLSKHWILQRIMRYVLLGFSLTLLALTQCACQIFSHHTMQEETRESLVPNVNCSASAKLYPEQNPAEDRILDQLTYRPCLNFTSHKGSKLNRSEPLNILLWEGSAGWEHISLQSGREVSCLIIRTLI